MDKPTDRPSLPLRKFIVLGEVDRWLRGLVDMVPAPSNEAQEIPQESALHTAGYMDVSYMDFYHHNLAFGENTGISPEDIKPLTGFRNLIAACSRNNIGVDVQEVCSGNIEVAFDPHAPFSKSSIFGKVANETISSLVCGKTLKAPRK